MKRHILPAVTAFATAATLLLTACGSGGEEPKADDKAAGADADRSDKKTPSPSPTLSDAAGRPRIEIPADVKYVFDWPATGDKTKDAVLNDGEQFIKAADMAITKQDPLHEAYRFYTEGDMAASTQAYTQGYVKNNATITGTARYYDATVTLGTDGSASLVYCQDQSKAYDKYIRTGKINRNTATKNSYVLYNSRLQKNDKNIWVTMKLISQRGSVKCQP